MTHATAKKLAQAVRAWLNFQAHCSRRNLFSEAYLAQPVGEFVLSVHSGEVLPEYSVPALKKASRGRPRQIDYALLSRDTSRLTCAIEAKWLAKGKEAPKQRIVNDLLRLELVRSQEGQHVYRYFLLAGEASAFKAFLSATVQLRGKDVLFTSELLPMEVGESWQNNVSNSKEPWRKLYRKFSNDHGVDLPKTFRVELVEDSWGGPCRVAIWRIKSSGRRAEIRLQ